jgi:hypothetical protein
MTTTISSHEVFENTVATFVDIASIMVAYTVGIHQVNFLVGVAYAFFDALVVVWMRKPLSRLVRHVFTIRGSRSSIENAYVADIA